MTIDPRFGMWFSIVAAIVSALGVCGTQFTTLFGDAMSGKILAVIVVLNVINSAVNAVLHMIPSKPGAPQEFPLGPKAVPAILLAVILGAFAFPGQAFAQTNLLPKPRLTGDLVADTKANLGIGTPRSSGLTGSPVSDILGALDEKLLPDLTYALKLATASGSKVTAPCYQAWIDIITTRQKAVTNADGSPLDLPNPRLITDFEKAVELRNALQPDSDFMIKCSPVASMVRKDIVGFIGIVISGGAGLAALVPGL